MTTDHNQRDYLDGIDADHDPIWTASHPEVAVHSVETCVALLGEAFVDAELEDMAWEDAALLLKRLRKARTDLHALEGTLESLIARRWRVQGLRVNQPVEGVGLVEVHRGGQRRHWEHTAVARDLIDAHMRDRGGEQPDPYEVRDWLLEAAGVSYWRVAPLRAVGLEPDDYAVYEKGSPTVKIT